jgi:hypothetical protein
MESVRKMSITDALIAALEDALTILKDQRKNQADAFLEIAAVIRKGEAAIRRAYNSERENAVLIKPQPAGVKIDCSRR